MEKKKRSGRQAVQVEKDELRFAEGQSIKAVVIGVHQERGGLTRSQKARERSRVSEELDELEALLDTLGAETVARLCQSRRKFDPAFFIGKGKAESLKALLEENDADLAVFDDDLTPAQNRNLEKLLGKSVMDRTGVILEIFSSHARTATAKLQVELAQLKYLLPRLKRAWTHLSRQKGAVNMRGAGEKQIELDRRIIGHRIAYLEERLTKLEVQRSTRREGRKNMFKAALVGYTNSGKSSLINALTGSNVLVQDQLFATLDSTVRKLTDARGVPIMVSDTVGFIRKLPHSLVASFKSTLEEVAYADLLLEVVDLSSPNFDAQKRASDEVLEELGLEDHPRIVVFNKIDLLSERSKLPAIVRSIHENSVCVSAYSGEGMEDLREAIRSWFDGNLEERVLELDQREGGVLSEIYEQAQVDSVVYREDGLIEVRFRATPREHDSIDRKLGRVR
jgi:GTP-binding protein HflX